MTTNDIADMEERQRFWTSVMRDGKELMANRLRASEFLAKMQNDFAAGAQPTQYGPDNVNSLTDEQLAKIIME